MRWPRWFRSIDNIFRCLTLSLTAVLMAVATALLFAAGCAGSAHPHWGVVLINTFDIAFGTLLSS